jgi:hypothetical protein
MNAPIRQCMGGWCQQRDKCANYTAPVQWGTKPAERLCEPGKDDPDYIRPTERSQEAA